MAFQMIVSVGWFLAQKSLDGAYNNVYGMVFGNDTSKLEKKIDLVIKQNELLRQELNKLREKEKKEKLDELKNNTENNIEFVLSVTEDYIDVNNINNLSQSVPVFGFKKPKKKKNKDSKNLKQTSDSDLDYDDNNIQEIKVKEYPNSL